MSYPPPPPPATSAPSGKPRLRGRIPLRLALIFGIIGIAGLVVGGLFVKSTFDTVDGFKRVSLAAGQGTVRLDSGKYVGYYEAPGHTKVFIQLAIADAQTRQPVRIGLYGKNTGTSSSLTYDRNGKHGEAVFKFNIDHSGSYLVQVATQDGNEPSGADVALGKSIAGKLVAGVVVLLVGVLFLVAAIILLIVGLVKRSRHKKQLATAGAYGYPPPPGYGQPQQYHPGYAPQQYPPGYAPPAEQGWQQPPPPPPNG